MKLGVLGPVELVVDGVAVGLGPPRRRAVLAALAVDAGRPVPAQTLIERVWGPDAPPTASSGLYAYLTRLREVFTRAGQADAAPRLVPGRGGYILGVDPDRVDLFRFRRLVQDARAGQGGGARPAGLLDEAVGLWRGPALAGLSGEWAERTRQLLEQERIDATLLWAAGQLRQDQAAAIVGPLRALLQQHPLVEPLAARLIEALARTGRTAEALACWAATRRRLVDELGAEPGAELRELHQALLAREPARPAAKAAHRPARTGPPGQRRPPAQLPLDPPHFTGRRAELAALDATLASAPGQPDTVPVATVSGTAGVGKTALVVHWAHRVADQFPDGQLYVNLRGFGATGSVSVAEAVRGFLHAFGVPGSEMPAGLDAQAALYRTTLAGKRVLVVLDNARDAGQVRPLLPGTAGCLVLVTSRDQLTPLIATEGAHPLALDLPDRAEATALLARRLGSGRVAREPQAAAGIVDHCSRLPLALAVAAARAAARPGLPLADVATGLRGATLDSFDGGDPATDVRTVFSWSYRVLGAAAGRLFRLLGLYPGLDIAAPAAASLAGLPPAQARKLLTELARANLVTEHTPGRYTLHDLLRTYAAERAHADDSAAERYAATHRLLDHYLHTAHAAQRQLHPRRAPVASAPPLSGATAEQPADANAALRWFSVERPALIAAVELGYATGFDSHTWQLARAVTDTFNRRGHWHDLTAVNGIALQAAQRQANRTGQAHALRGLGLGEAGLGQLDTASKYAQLALDLFEELGDLSGQIATHRNLAWTAGARGDHHTALDHDTRTLVLCRLAGDLTGQAAALNGIGWHRAHLGDHQQALADCQQALILQEQAGDTYGRAHTLDSLGYLYNRLGRHQDAIDRYQDALELFHQAGDSHSEATCLNYLGETHQAAGDPAAAHAAWQQALDILDALDHPDADQIRPKLSPPA
ncbi:MAG TPA: BTAD domain-containing putative transcriptional regulator [Mycobacteriales bacterium]|nr:BTAD domain-containing putative transcriptional regulator [Mycobacteriales bacterium]